MSALTYGGLFEGYGGLTEAVRRVLGGDLSWYSEVEPAANRVLEHHHPGVPNLGDVTAVDWSAVPRVNVLTGGFPCQDVSSAGLRSGLKEGTRSGLWSHMAKGIDVLRPDLVVIENVRGILSTAAAGVLEPCPWCVGDDESVPLRALGCVLGDLADVGYDAQWCGLRASDVGAAHPRFRVVVVAWPAADPDSIGSLRPWSARDGWCGSPHHDLAPADPDGAGPQGRGLGGPAGPPAQRDDPSTPANSAGDGRQARRPESTGFVGGPDAALGDNESIRDTNSFHRQGRGPAGFEGQARSTADGYTAGVGERDQSVSGAAEGQQVGAVSRAVGGDRTGNLAEGVRELGGVAGELAWGVYEPAVRRWERVLGRPAPSPTVTGKRGGQQLSPLFVEWLMGLPAGHVTAVPGITRSEALKLLGNGVVPQQIEAAVRFLLPAIRSEVAA